MALNPIFSRAKRQIISAEYYGDVDQFEQITASAKQYWAFKIYEHNYKDIVQATLRSRYLHAWKDIDRYVDPVWNPLKKVANIKAQAYSRPPIRRTENADLRKIMMRAAHGVNRSLSRAEKLLNACGNVLVWPCIGYEKAAPILSTLVLEPHMVYLEANYEDGRYDIVARYTDYYLISEYRNGARTNYTVDKSGNAVKRWLSIGNPVWCSVTEGKFGMPRTIGPISDLLVGTITIGVMEAFAAKVMFLKSFKQPFMASEEGRGVSPDKYIAGPDQLWPAAIDVMDLADKNDFFEVMIENMAIRLAGQHGVSKLVMTGEYRDGESWVSVNEELTRHYEEQIENAQSIERALWSSVCEMDLVSVDPDAKIWVKFQPPYQGARDPRTEWELHRERVKAGVESTLEWIGEHHPELETEEEMKALYDHYIELYAEEVNSKRKLNIADNGNSPQVNGSLARQYGEQGRNGPAVDGKEVEIEKVKEANDVN